MVSLRLVLLGLISGCLFSGAVIAEEIKARGVNPAENDTRFDLIFKYNRLPNKTGIFTTTAKFDYRISPEVGLNIEMPVLGNFRSPASGSARAINDTGVGDLFVRLRYIVPLGVSALGATSFGIAAEGVFPTASHKTLGSGTYQLNASALAVQAWSPTLITAFVAKAAQSIDELDGRKTIQENTLRVVQAFVLPRGMFVTLDGKYNWETVNKRDIWWEGAVEVGMMLDARTAASLSVGRKWGDREDRGSVTLGMKRFF
jgi:hypothetical protein